MVVKKLARSSQRLVTLTGAVVLLLLAATLLAAQRSIDQIDSVRPQVAQLFSDALGVPVALGALSADWQGPIPRLEIASLTLLDQAGQAPLRIVGLRLELNLWQSLWHRSLVWRELSAERVAVVISEERPGRWGLAGLSRGASALNPEILLAPLAYSRFVQLLDLDIELQPQHSDSYSLRGTQLRIENQRDFHRLQATLGFAGGGESALQLVAEGRGDPLDRESFTGTGYLQLVQLDLAAPLATVGMSLFPELFVDLQASSKLSVPLVGEIWLSLAQGGVVELHGELGAEQIPLDWARDLDPLTQLRGQLSGWYTPGQDWGLRLQQVDVSWAERAIEPFNMALSLSLADAGDFALAFNQVKIDLLVELLSDSGLLLAKWRSLLGTLNPRGQLGAVTVGRTAGDYFVGAELRDFSVDRWRGVPGVRGLDGQLELRGERAVLQLADDDGLQLLLAPSYQEYIGTDSAAGLITAEWSQATKQFAIAGERLAAGALGGNAEVDFYSWRSDASSRADSLLELRITAAGLRGAGWPNYLPATLPERLTDWLSEALQQPAIDQFALLVRADRDGADQLSLSSQVAVELGAGQLEFTPGWPRLEQLNGSLLISDGALVGQFDQLASGGLAVTGGQLSLPAGGTELAISARADAPLADYQRYLINTPLASTLSALLDWQYRGTAAADIGLTIPVGGEASDGLDYTIDVVLADGAVKLGQPALELDQLAGELTISRDAGVVADAVVGRAVGAPLKLAFYRDVGGQRVSVDTVLNAELLTDVSGIDWSALVAGSANLSGLLTIPPADSSQPLRMTLQSDQLGLAYQLPPPLLKTADRAEPLSTDVRFAASGQLLSINSQPVAAELLIEQGAIARGVINVGGSEPLPSGRELLLAASQPSLDWRAWRQWWAGLPAAVVEPLTRPAESDKDSLAVRFAVALGAFNEPWLSTEQLVLGGQFEPAGVSFDVTAEQFAGVGYWPYSEDDRTPISLALTRLALPEFTAAGADDEALSWDISGLPAIDFSVQALSYGERELGSLSFDLRPAPGQLTFGRLGGELLGVRLGGQRSVAGDLPPSELVWDYAAAEPMTQLTGSFATGDIAALFQLLGGEPIADSSEAYFKADLNWPGHPWQVDSQQLSGDLALELWRGEFYNRSGGGDAALRAVSLFNFANWLRRLQFDFTDVFGDNLSYDRLDGSLRFARGRVNLSPPLTARLPSGKMALAAELDLVEQTIDGKLVATLPVATNLPWIVALVGGLPAAAGVYLTSVVMSKQLDRLSSISYTLSGRWDDIELAVDKVFARQLKE